MHIRRIETLCLWSGLVFEQFPTFKKPQSLDTPKTSKTTLNTLRTTLAFVLVSGLICFTSSAIAGNFYFRGGAAHERFEETVFMDTYCPSGTPAALYGCGTGSDGLPYRSKGGFDRFQSIEIGLGLSTLSNIRVEFSLDYQKSAVFNGNTNFLATGSQQSVMAELSTVTTSFVGYLDLPNLSLPGPRKAIPYIGAGFGYSRNRIETTTMTFPVTTTTVPGATETSLTWLMSFGVSMELSTRTKVDLGVRYMDRSRLRTGLGEGVVTWRNGARGPLVLNLARTEAKLRGLSLRLSLLYSL
ncbi:MAG: hypothetical protein F4W92_08110 [Gammaproteobacteria bacterium]|nr:hypothetical protein [Gammaproteobacteria bacterium]